MCLKALSTVPDPIPSTSTSDNPDPSTSSSSYDNPFHPAQSLPITQVDHHLHPSDLGWKTRKSCSAWIQGHASKKKEEARGRTATEGREKAAEGAEKEAKKYQRSICRPICLHLLCNQFTTAFYYQYYYFYSFFFLLSCVWSKYNWVSL